MLTCGQSLEQAALGLFIISFIVHAFPSSLPPFSGVWLVPGEGGIMTCKTAKVRTADLAEQGSHPRSLQQQCASHRACHNPQQNLPIQKPYQQLANTVNLSAAALLKICYTMNGRRHTVGESSFMFLFFPLPLLSLILSNQPATALSRR